MEESPMELSSAAEATLRSLQVDLVTAEVVGALRDAGVRPILLKGPSVALWLYEPGSSRSYVDCDLLVSPTQLIAAQVVLSERGFTEQSDDSDTAGWHLAAHEWTRDADGASVDLHRTITGVEVDAAHLWGILSQATETITVGGAQAEALSPAAKALHVALHAAQHGSGLAQPLADLERALEILPNGVWDDASTLATRLGAASAFATGLRLVPAGVALADRLGLPVETSTEVALRATTPPPTALAWEYVAGLPGWRARTRFVARRLVPSQRWIRASSPLARRGRLGLAVAYLFRPIRVLWGLVPGFMAWRRARRRP